MLRARAANREPDLVTIAEAFSRTAARYDAFAEDHPHLSRMRAKVYDHVRRVVAPGARILELNAGTGTDAAALAELGYRVHATDIAPGMLERLGPKLATADLAGRVTAQACSFLELDRIEGAPYDAVFSNLGGLNCTADLQPVIAGLDRVLRPGGVIVWVLMPPICLWELGLVLAGQPRLALRRLAPRGTRARLEGLEFEVHYFRPQRVARLLRPRFDILGVEGLSVLTPTAESRNLARRHPRVYGSLAWLDDRLAPRRPFSGWGDFYILSARDRRPTGADGAARGGAAVRVTEARA